MQDELIQKETEQSIGERLYILRNQRGFTQEDLAEKLAVSRQSISKWELDKTLPDVEKLIQLAEIYQVSMDYLVKGTGATSNPTECGDEPLAQTNVMVPSDWKLKSTVNKVILSIGALISGVMVLVFLVFGIGFVLNQTVSLKDKRQDVVSVDRIERQYTKAQVSSIDEEGNILNKTLWLDTIGVREGDWVFVYCDEDDTSKLSMDYYTSTILLPFVMAIIFLIFFIILITELRMIGGRQNGEKK